MASSSSSKRWKKVARTTWNASPTRWISDDAAREKFLCWRKIRIVTKFEKYVVDQFKRAFMFRIEKKVDVLVKNHIISDSSIDESDDEDESTNEDSMDMSELE
ncbi:hypothetical protein LR48_Vigan03g178000 [Vigna angularis]|uniref:Uncharacterized protein n=1 Tax=Phaseolus angularis TaxID=3914 RepID=A0A0L9U6E6_PHAAN|nr:hypothetical protein LR48_Vigan03g178000 [Vigna angularis]